MKKIVVLSGAGVSAESGIKTFRDHDGLWEGHDVMQVASPEGWRRDRALVLDFYNQRRRQLQTVTYNKAHENLAKLEKYFDVEIITQNVDDLHEKAGSSKVMHLHGELNKVRSTIDEKLVYEWTKDLNEGDLCEKGGQLRPHIVWFGEAVPLLEAAVDIIAHCDIVIIIGTSLQVYPAASLISYAPQVAPVYYIDPKPFISNELSLRKHQVISEKASSGTDELIKILLETENLTN